MQMQQLPNPNYGICEFETINVNICNSVFYYLVVSKNKINNVYTRSVQ